MLDKLTKLRLYNKVKKLRYHAYRSYASFWSLVLLPYMGSKHHARCKVLNILYGVIEAKGDITVQIIADTDEQERLARLLVRDFDEVNYGGEAIRIVGDSRADVCIRIDENWMTTVKTRCGVGWREYYIGPFQLPAIRDGEAPDEYHGFELDEIDATPTTLDDLVEEGEERC